MNPLGELADAVRGWGHILRGRADAAGFFKTGAAGVTVGAGYFVLALLLSVAAQSAAIGMPGPGQGQVLFGLVVQAVTVAVLTLAIARSLRFFRLNVPFTTLLVPVLYALAFSFVIGIPLTLMGPNVALIVVFALGYLIFRAAMVLAGMRFGVALAFALLCVIVLVVVPNGLYMLASVLPSPA